MIVYWGKVCGQVGERPEDNWSVYAISEDNRRGEVLFWAGFVARKPLNSLWQVRGDRDEPVWFIKLSA